MSPLQQYVEAMFSSLPRTEPVVKMKMNILDNMDEKYAALLEEGKSEEEALGIVISQFGSMDEIRRELGSAAQADACAGSAAVCAQPEDGKLDALMREYHAFRIKAHLATACAVFLFLLAPVLVINHYYIVSFSAVIALGVSLLIFFRGRLGDYRELIAERRQELGLEPLHSLRDKWYPGISRRRRALYMSLLPIALVIFFILGVGFELWHPGWIVFLFIPIILCILEVMRKDGEE